MKGISPESILAAMALMQEARDLLDRLDPLTSTNPMSLSARLSHGVGELRGHLIHNLPERIQLRDAA
jgi:hypothetical protein